MVSAKVKGKETGRVRKRQRVRSYLQVLGCMVGLGLVNGCSDKNQRQFHSTILISVLSFNDVEHTGIASSHRLLITVSC